MKYAQRALIALVMVVGSCASPNDGTDAGDSHSRRDVVDEAQQALNCYGCGGSTRCPGGFHVDCFSGFGCTQSGIPYVSVGAPYHTCTLEDAQRAAEEGICAGYSFERQSPCPNGCAFARIDPRYAGCTQPSHYDPNTAWLVRMLCSPSPQVGDVCSREQDCHPAPDEPDANLRCLDGRCAQVPRPDPPPHFGESCGLPENGLSPWVFPGPIPCLVYGAPGCFVQRRTMQCLVDEQCPAGWDCAVGAPCQGYCVPRGVTRDYHRLPTSCSASDAGPDANDASDASDGG